MQLPLIVVRVTVPDLLKIGANPFRHEFATDGYPDAANINRNYGVRVKCQSKPDKARIWPEAVINSIQK